MEQFNADMARKASINTEYDNVIKLIKEASSRGERKIIVEKFKNSNTMKQLEKMDFNIIPKTNSLEENMTDEQVFFQRAKWSMWHTMGRTGQEPYNPKHYISYIIEW